jgi:sulfur carrier protein
MTKIRLNGEIKEIKTHSNAFDLLNQLEIEARRLAIEVNEEILPRSQFDQYIFKENDQIEIVHAIGGG